MTPPWAMQSFMQSLSSSRATSQPPVPVPARWEQALRGRPGVTVLRDAAVDAPWGPECLPAVILHRRGAVVLEPRAPHDIACMSSGGSGAASPCRAVLDARRRADLLQRHIVGRARRLFPRRLFPRRFAAALDFSAVVLVEAPPNASASAAATGRTGRERICSAIVWSVETLVAHLDEHAHPPSRRALPVLSTAEAALLAAELAVPLSPPSAEATTARHFALRFPTGHPT
ncbi:hypothetical protein C882_0983 [Caenispirillum salinarum AK4]|uniref:Uncharacterized protein n=1 Tax=Caenispirillum salinarum AK4 TaxID=1238182 RepID=K9GUH9_9PROT|nr:hypothetical protein [Caenispirillum salinarum]EKV28409.1 hypothetical protein C882_0983 [Caenispirillum salinarum AK4]